MNTYSPIWAPLERFLERSAALFPVLLAVLVVLAAGLLVAVLAESLVRWLLSAVGFDRLGRGRHVAEVLRRTSLRQSPSAMVGQGVRWLVVVFTLLGAISILSAEATDTVLTAMVHYLPRLAAGLLLIVLGWAVATFATRSVLIWAVNSRLQGGPWLAAGVRVLVSVFFMALALENLGFGRDIAVVVLAILLGGGVFAASLAFGLAGKDLAHSYLEKMTRDLSEEDRDTLSHL
jgi:hypothetical protein